MRTIAYATDMHSDIAALKAFLQHARQEKPDLTIVSGDLIDRMFDDSQLNKKQLEFKAALLRGSIKQNNPKYLEFMKLAFESVREKYSQIRNSLEESGLQIVTIPGNYDWIGCLEVLNGFDIHGELVERGRFRVLGYGSSSEVPSTMPASYTLDYELPPEIIKGIKQKKEEAIEVGKKPAEGSSTYVPVNLIPPQKYQAEGRFAAEMIGNNRPDIFVSHKPAFGVGDKLFNGSRIGSIPIRIALQLGQPILMTSGHVHEDSDVAYVGNTLVINPGILGTFNEDRGGCFAHLIEDENKIKEVIHYIFDEKREGLNGKIVLGEKDIRQVNRMALEQYI